MTLATAKQAISNGENESQTTATTGKQAANPAPAVTNDPFDREAQAQQLADAVNAPCDFLERIITAIRTDERRRADLEHQLSLNKTAQVLCEAVLYEDILLATIEDEKGKVKKRFSNDNERKVALEQEKNQSERWQELANEERKIRHEIAYLDANIDCERRRYAILLERYKKLSTADAGAT